MGEKIDYITKYKVVLMFLIVFYHCGLLWNSNWGPIVIEASSDKFLNLNGFVVTFLGNFHIHAFVFASGFLFYEIFKIQRYAKKHAHRKCILSPQGRKHGNNLLFPAHDLGQEGFLILQFHIEGLLEGILAA